MKICYQGLNIIKSDKYIGGVVYHKDLIIISLRYFIIIYHFNIVVGYFTPM